MSANRRPIYLDYQATTPVDPRVLAAMLPYFTEQFGNPASKTHSLGNQAFAAVEAQREILAKAINAKPQEIVFTSGATEAINLAIKGVALSPRGKGGHFITVSTEHKAVLDCFAWLSSHGFATTILPVLPDGLLDLPVLEAALRPDTVLVAVMAANNEIGVIQPLAEIGKLCSDRGILFLSDATQALGKLPLNVQDARIDLLVASGHKLYGPKGIGLCYVRRSNPKVVLEPLIHGGGHERGLRSGTLPTPNIVGFGQATEIALKEMRTEQKRILGLRQKLLSQLTDGIPDIVLNGHPVMRLAGNLNLMLPNVSAEALLVALRDDLALSSGSACTSAAVLPSHVLTAIGLNPSAVHSSIRIGLGRSTTESDIDHAAQCIVLQARRIASLHQVARV